MPDKFFGELPLTIANTLTFLRIFISPIFLFLYLEHEALYISDALLPYVLLFLLCVSEISDALDGYLARKYHQVTDFGKLLDPMADSIMRTSIFLAFTQPPVKIPLLLVFVFIYRDAVIAALRTVCALRGFALAASSAGKSKTAFQAIICIAIVILLIPHASGSLETSTLQSISLILVALAALITIYSGLEYLFVNRSYLGKLLYSDQQRDLSSGNDQAAPHKANPK